MIPPLPLPALLPARSAAATLSALLLLLVVLVNLPALLVLSFTAAGPTRSDALIAQITAWTGVLLAPATPVDAPVAFPRTTAVR